MSEKAQKGTGDERVLLTTEILRELIGELEAAKRRKNLRRVGDLRQKHVWQKDRVSSPLKNCKACREGTPGTICWRNGKNNQEEWFS